MWPISRGQIRFIILTCSNDQVDHPFPGLPLRFSIDRVANPTNAPLCYHPALECSLPSLQVLYTIVAWKLVDTRDKRCASPCLPSPFPFHLIFRHFRRPAPRTNTKENRAELSRSITIISISSRGGKLKWSKIEECDRWRIFDILVYFYNIWLRIRWMDRFRYFSNILLLFERRNWSMINSIDLILIILDIYSWIIKLEDWSDIYIYIRSNFWRYL